MADLEIHGNSIPDTPAYTRWTRRMPLMLLVGGIVVAAFYYTVAVGRDSGGHPSPVQADTFTYMQYARAMAEGHPYVFSPGETPSTGSTSHLYPVVLAIAYFLGARGEALLSAGFLVNVCCYLIWLQLFWRVARCCVPAKAVLAAGVAMLNGQLAFVVMGQSDMGLFLALSWGLLVALLHGRFGWATALASLCVLARPEGMMLAAGLGALAAVLLWRRMPRARALLRVAGAGLLTVVAVLALNRLLTGMWQFQSVAGKGYLNSFPLIGALGCAAGDFLTLLRELLFNLGGAPRHNYFVPVIGGCLAILGLAGVWRATGFVRSVLAWWLVCCLGALGLIAQSEFQGLGTDRYLVWILPFWYLLAVAGVGVAAQWQGRGRAILLGLLLLGFEAATWPYFLARFAAETLRMQSLMSFSRTVHATLPPGEPVGMLVGVGVRYGFGQRPVRHVNGITSSFFRGQRDLVCCVETLRHEPETRFGYWLVPASLQGWCVETGFLGQRMLADSDSPSGDNAFSLFQACWDPAAPVGLLPLDAAVTNAVAGMKLVDRLDVGYMPDERRCDYQFGSRLTDTRFLPFAACRRMGAVRIAEVGQVVIGWDEFRVAAPMRGSPVRLVMRTALDASCTAVRTRTRHMNEEVYLRTPLRLRLLVNGVTLPEQEVAVVCASDAFAECMLTIPPEYVTGAPLDIVIAGDHIAMGYWIYQ